ncbi:MAG: transporter substrate-binding protein [Lacrimispora sp.]|nr:transporter substrate-binding protein [Lacrimispora sp.]
MKKPLALILIAAMILCLNGCGSGNAVKESSKASAETKAVEAEAAQATAKAAPETTLAVIATPSVPELILKYGEVNPEGNFDTKVAEKFAEYVYELSNGRIKVDIFPGGVMGDEKTSLNSLRTGNGLLDLYRVNTNVLTGYGFKKLNLFGLPYIFRSREGMWKVLENEELGRAFLNEGQEIGTNMVGLFYTDEGARNIFTTEPIKGLADLKNKRIRVPESVLMMDTMSALGAQPIPMRYEDLYSALANGDVEGGENPIPGYLSNRFYEVAPYYLLSEHVFSPGIIMMSERKWNTLSKEDQNILRQAGKMASEWNKKEIVSVEESLKKEMVEKGVTVIPLTREEEAEARKDEEIVRVSFTPGLEKWLYKIIEIQK